MIKGTDPLDVSYLDLKIDEKFENISSQWKKDIKEEILIDIRNKMNYKFEEMKKAFDEKFDISISDVETMDIVGHGQSHSYFF